MNNKTQENRNRTKKDNNDKTDIRRTNKKKQNEGLK